MAAGIEQKLDWQNVTILLVDNQDLDRPIGAKYTATHGGGGESVYFARNTLMGQSRSWISRSPVLSLIDYKSLLVPHVKTSKKNILWPVV